MKQEGRSGRVGRHWRTWNEAEGKKERKKERKKEPETNQRRKEGRENNGAARRNTKTSSRRNSVTLAKEKPSGAQSTDRSIDRSERRGPPPPSLQARPSTTFWPSRANRLGATPETHFDRQPSFKLAKTRSNPTKTQRTSRVSPVTAKRGTEQENRVNFGETIREMESIRSVQGRRETR